MKAIIKILLFSIHNRLQKVCQANKYAKIYGFYGYFLKNIHYICTKFLKKTNNEKHYFNHSTADYKRNYNDCHDQDNKIESC